jgi:tetratricopeptide (TPR) repeat protein
MDRGASTGQEQWAEQDWSTGQDSSAVQEAPIRQDQTVEQDSSSAFLQSRNASLRNSRSGDPEKQQLKEAPPQSQSKIPFVIGGIVCLVVAMSAAAFYSMSVNSKRQVSVQTDSKDPAQIANTPKWLKLKKEGDSEFKNGHIKSSLTLFQEASANAQSADEHDPQLISLYNSLARSFYEEGRYKDAEAALTKATSICEKDDKLDDSLASAETKTILGSVLSSQGNFEKADKLFDRALVIARNNCDDENPDSVKSLAANNVLASALLARAGMHIKQKQSEAALIELNEALTKRKASLTALHNGGTKNKTALVQEQESVAEIENEIGRAYETESKFAAAKDAYKQAEKDAQASVGSHHPVYADSLCGLASIDSMQSHFADAATQYEQAKVIRELYFGTHNLRTAEAVACLGILKTLQKGQYDDGIALLDEALSVRQELLGTDNPEVKKFAKRCDEIKRSGKR